MKREPAASGMVCVREDVILPLPSLMLLPPRACVLLRRMTHNPLYISLFSLRLHNLAGRLRNIAWASRPPYCNRVRSSIGQQQIPLFEDLNPHSCPSLSLFCCYTLPLFRTDHEINGIPVFFLSDPFQDQIVDNVIDSYSSFDVMSTGSLEIYFWESIEMC